MHTLGIEREDNAKEVAAFWMVGKTQSSFLWFGLYQR